MTFHRIHQGTEETFDRFLGRLRVQGRRCGFSAQEFERELRDRCVAGSCRRLQEQLLRKAAEKGDALALQDITAAAQVFETVRRLDSQMHGESSVAEELQAVYAKSHLPRLVPRPSVEGRKRKEGALGGSQGPAISVVKPATCEQSALSKRRL